MRFHSAHSRAIPSSAHPGLVPAAPRLRGGFTLIELLIVIAIIAILALIAVPNFLEAQTRARVARVMADFRGLETAIESYRMDQGAYPWFDDGQFTPAFNPLSYRLWVITTPVSYMTTVDIVDPFIEQGAHGDYSDDIPRNQYNFRNYRVFQNLGWECWVLNSLGPDRIRNQGLKVEMSPWARNTDTSNDLTMLYDPTNGTVSIGDMPKTGGDTRFRNIF